MFVFSDVTYQVAKKLVQIILPAISSFYFGLASIWGLPAPDKVVGTIAVLTTFIGVCMGISTREYEKSGAAYDGKMFAIPQEGKTVYSLEFEGDPEDIKDKSSIRFKVCPTVVDAEVEF
jgi:hypothetical protein